MDGPQGDAGIDLDSLRAVVEGVESATGAEFFHELVRHLAEALRVDYALVSELSADRLRFRTLAVWGPPGRFLENLDIPCAGTPCGAVLGGRAMHHADGLMERFPEDVGLVEWRAVSYAGVPVTDVAGNVMGHLAVFHRRPMPEGERAIAVMRLFAARVRVERERQRAALALERSEARYRDLYEHAPLSYMTFDRQGRIQAWNARALQITGYPAETLPTLTVPQFLVDSPETRDALERLEREVFDAGQQIAVEIPARRGDGTPYWARCVVSPLRDADGAIVGARSIAEDITHLKEAERAVRESQARLAAVIDSASDAILVVGDEGRIVLFNPSAEMVLRCAAADAVGTLASRFMTPAAQASFDRARDALARGTARVAFSEPGLRARRADGEEFEFEASLSLADVGGGQLFTVILRDVEERRRLAQQAAYLQEEIKAAHNFDEIVGRSATLVGTLRKIDLVAPTDSTVLLLGETGTGKELVARAIHSRSARRDRPLIKVNCASLPSGLVESELFGHEKGAFTGAIDRRIGRFELAHHGTIFLDEVGELPLDVQAKLLRVLQEREFERVGGRTSIPVDVRVIAATNRDLAAMVQAGAFRQDLFYRLHVFPLTLPPLRDRREDVPELVHYFLARYATKIGRRIERVSPSVMERLVAYAWPGNVRELENVVERAVILSAGPELDVAPELLPSASSAVAPAAPRPAVVPSAPRPATPVGEELPLEEVERRHIVAVLDQVGWRIEGPSGAAHALGLSPSTLRSRMQRLGIRRPAPASSFVGAMSRRA